MVRRSFLYDGTKAQSIDKVLGLHIAKVDDYISKPFSPQELIDSVEKVLAQRKKN